jgi:tRNA (Thr-GGU) A37 N-methylase
VHPRDDPTNPERGVFGTRSASRPNPIGLHQVEIVSIAGNRFLVSSLEAVDGTPIVDVKPMLGPSGTR